MRSPYDRETDEGGGEKTRGREPEEPEVKLDRIYLSRSMRLRAANNIIASCPDFAALYSTLLCFSKSERPGKDAKAILSIANA